MSSLLNTLFLCLHIWKMVPLGVNRWTTCSGRETSTVSNRVSAAQPQSIFLQISAPPPAPENFLAIYITITRQNRLRRLFSVLKMKAKVIVQLNVPIRTLCNNITGSYTANIRSWTCMSYLPCHSLTLYEALGEWVVAFRHGLASADFDRKWS